MIVTSPMGTLDLSKQDKESRLESLNGLFKSLYAEQQIVQEVIVDDVTYTVDYNYHLLDHIMSIRKVYINTVHEAQFVQEVMGELKSYLPKLVRACDSISELFYGEMNEEDWVYFGQLTEGLQWVGQSIYSILNYSEKVGNITLDAEIKRFNESLEQHVAELENLLQQQDYTAVGDLIKYEMPDNLSALLRRLELEVHA